MGLKGLVLTISYPVVVSKRGFDSSILLESLGEIRYLDNDSICTTPGFLTFL